jgi:pSer/pThr/pTyr-binding forkhead associated (FHA) protein
VSPLPPDQIDPSQRRRSGKDVIDVIGERDAQQEAPPRRTRRQLGVELTPCWLTITSSGRHMALPVTGELVLGRFDPNLGIPPDVDLGYEDGEAHTISRRHLKIVGANGRHTIEDMGSRHGVYLNGEKIGSSPSRPLRLGDRIAVGEVDLYYDTVPSYLVDVVPTADARHLLTVTATGRRLAIAPANDVIIGRSDRYVDFVPHVDLSQEGELAVRVSRRHAVITWRNYNPYLEDLGSGFGTKVNGETLLIGHAIPLKAGDHIWLGGLVLAYDLEL